MVDDATSWHPEEDDRLLEALSTVEPCKSYWGRVACIVGTRTAKACKERAELTDANVLAGITPREYEVASQMLYDKRSVREIGVTLGLSTRNAYMLCGRIAELRINKKPLPREHKFTREDSDDEI